MDRDRKICIWYEPGRPWGLRWWKEAAYCWSCPCSVRSRGRNSFNRFSDHARLGRGAPSKNYRHPYDRCWDAVELHLWRRHRDEEAE